MICRASAPAVPIVPRLPASSHSLCLQCEAAGFCLLDQKSDRIRFWTGDVAQSVAAYLPSMPKTLGSGRRKAECEGKDQIPRILPAASLRPPKTSWQSLLSTFPCILFPFSLDWKRLRKYHHTVIQKGERGAEHSGSKDGNCFPEGNVSSSADSTGWGSILSWLTLHPS